MFDGERIVMQKERLTRDTKFLLRNGVIPFSRISFDLPLIERTTSRHEVLDNAEWIFERLLEHVDIRIPHQLFFTYRHSWQPSDAKTAMSAFDELCSNLSTQVKMIDVSRSMFGFRVNIFDSLIPWATHRKKVLVADISTGISTHYGDGQRHHDGGGKWSFTQMKGMRTHTGHIYIRGIAT